MMNHSLQRKIYSWLVWMPAACFFFYKYFIQVSPSVMSQQLMATFQLSGANFGNLAACFFYAYLLMQIPAGVILDRYNPSKVLPIAIFFCAFSVLLFSKAQYLVTAEISRFFIGLSAAFASLICFKLISLWFPPRRFAFMAGLSMTAAMLGAIGGQAPLSYLVEHFDWRQALVYIAWPGIILAIISLFIQGKQPSAKAAPTVCQPSILQQFKTILICPQTWLLSFYSGLAFAPVSVFGGLWGVAYIQKAYQLEAITAARIVSGIFIGFAIGCPLSGWLSDRMQRRKPLMYFGTVLALISITLVLYFPLSITWLNVMLFIFGLASSCFFLCFSMIKELHHLMIAGTVIGFMNSFDSLWEAFSEPLIGKLLDSLWDGKMNQGARAFKVQDYQWALTALVIYFMLAFVLLLLLKETHCQNKTTQGGEHND